MAEMTKAAKWHTNAIREPFSTSHPTPTRSIFSVSSPARTAKTFGHNFWSNLNSFECTWGTSNRYKCEEVPMTEVADG